MGWVARRAGRRWVRALLTALGTSVLVAGLLLGGIRGGYPATRPQLLSGMAWLASSQVGQLTLLDGSSAEVAAQVQVASRGDRLDVAQRAATAYAVNRSAGTVVRVDGATFEVSRPATPVPQVGSGLQVLPGADAVFALDSRRGVLTRGDSKTLTGWTPPVPVARQIGAQAAVLDGAGRLWVLDTQTGDLTWVEHGRQHVRHGVVEPGSGLLVLADGVPVVVDAARHTAVPLDPQTGASRGTVLLDVRPEDQVQVGGSPHGARIYLVAQGLLSTCDLGATRCDSVLPLSTGGGDLGTPVEAGGRLFIPDYATGRVLIVDLARSQVVAQPRILDPKVRYQLLTRDGVVFFNDPDSEHAGVIRLDGGVRPVAKYNPKQPETGLSQAVSPATPPSTKPNEPPPTAPAPLHPAPNPGPPAPAPPDPASPPTGPPEIRISVSKSTAQVGEDVTFDVSAVSGPAPGAARWTFGDGAGAAATPTTHRWGTAQTYQVSVVATFADGRTATGSVAIVVTQGPPPTGSVTVSRTGSGGGSVASQPAGVSCPPTCSATFPAGTAVTLTATPASGADFGGWTGCASNTTTCQLTVPPSAVSVGADFGPAAPSANCGDVVTANIKLRNDLTCTRLPGLSVRGAGVTVDLGGFTVSGPGFGTGVSVEANNVAVKNGKVTAFGWGIAVSNVTNLTVVNVVSTGSDRALVTGIGMRPTVTVRGSTLAGRTFAVHGANAESVTITGSALSGKVAFGQTNAVTLTGDSLNGAAISLSETNNVLIAGNPTVTNTTVDVFNCFGVVIRNNLFQGGDVAVTVEKGLTTGLQILDNTFSGGSIGVRARLNFLDEMRGAVISGNTFANNSATGVFLEALNARPTATVRVSGNTFTGNGRASGGLTDGAGRSVNDGLHLNLPAGESIVVSGNTARNNNEYGIESANPVSDGGGVNHASGNGNPAQCLGLTCAP